jgi:two-component system OmpR family sensor kinase
MSLRLRLTLLIASVFLGFWLVSSLWLITGLRSELNIALDQRLQSTAAMLSNILATVPENELGISVPAIMQGNEMGSVKGLSCQISSLHGTVIASSNIDSLPINASLSDGFGYLRSDTAQWRTYALRTNRFVITIADKISERESLHLTLLESTLIPPAIALLASLALLWVAIGRGLLPIRKLAVAVEKRGSDDLSPVKLDKPSQELQPLLTSQNALMARLSEGMKREQQFTNNAAHELRTPLAGILAQIQLAELSADSGRDRALLMAKVSAQRLNTILDNLLALARVESEIALSSVAPWALGSMVKNIVWEANKDAQRITYRVNQDNDITFVPQPLISIVCRNLLENAIKYGEAATPVMLSAESSSSGIKIEVRNSGNVCSEDIPHMTSRFWRKGETQGAGLGLSIVNAIATKYKGSLIFQNVGEDFLVTFII